MVGYMPDENTGADNIGGEYVMQPTAYPPEGMESPVRGLDGALRAMERGEIIEAQVTLCDHRYNLHVRIADGIYGIIPREESQYTSPGEGIKDIAILTRVGKRVAVKITDVNFSGGVPFFTLSRRAAQEECMEKYVSRLSPGDIIPARVTHLEGFGAFVDIGCGICSLLSIDAMSVSRISHPRERIGVGDYIHLVVRGRDDRGRITVSMKELFGTWEENAALYREGQTVRGIVRSIESYGVFVELKPNLAGLAEWREDVYPGDAAAVFIKAIIPEKMKVKLIIIDSEPQYSSIEEPSYFIDTDRVRRIERWQYSPIVCKRKIESVFG